MANRSAACINREKGSITMSGFVWEDALFREYFPKLVKIAMHYVHDMPLAEDMAQEAFLVFLDKKEAGALDSCENIGAWLKTVVVNRCRSEMQRMRYHVEEPLLDEVIHPHGPEQLSFAEQLPKGLSDAERQALCCFYEYRMSHKEMAAFYGISEEACRVRLYRARMHCKALLQEAADA